ncbi:hypothetical protein [Clostridioides difficile]|uniref:hypothetical protein n=1 Tax=Clostridioides difficile TaxID=1496 RepID=UPI00097FF07C|nr:hypothetical protein [Clostridioides difficile]EIS9472686.1 hypothetical protein [Clostridioides difficile]EIS9653956.1 hypothetical protein [Clostridioides difficile]EJA6589929.1 hypothetical protein [Clostridioides difficile]SJO38714.1 Uncharacterised protein [Clostridioides difficile]SJO82826.1 Uncharacterised protein [Clostridioides difficile]
MKYECGKAFLECDKGSFEINDTRIEEVMFESTEIDNPFERVKYEGTFTIISGWEYLQREMLWLKILHLSAVVAKIMQYKMLGILIREM